MPGTIRLYPNFCTTFSKKKRINEFLVQSFEGHPIEDNGSNKGNLGLNLSFLSLSNIAFMSIFDKKTELVFFAKIPKYKPSRSLGDSCKCKQFV